MPREIRGVKFRIVFTSDRVTGDGCGSFLIRKLLALARNR